MNGVSAAMLPSALSFATLSPLAAGDESSIVPRTSVSYGALPAPLPEHLEQLAAAWALPLLYHQQYELHTRLLPYFQLATAKKVCFLGVFIVK